MEENKEKKQEKEQDLLSSEEKQALLNICDVALRTEGLSNKGVTFKNVTYFIEKFKL